jgi:hypothetical protein
MKILHLLLGFALPLAAAPAAEPALVIIDSLAGLADYAGRDHVRVKMQPGVYLLNDATMARAAEVKYPEVAGKAAGSYRVNTLIHFAGSDSAYDLTGVVIHLDTKLHQTVRGPLDKLFISGHRTTISGLEFVDQGDTPPGRGGLRMLHVIGDGNRIENVTLRARGSAPYGYGNLLGKGGNALVPLYKQSCLLITGRDNRIIGAKVIARVFGHGIVMQGAVNTLIQGCYVEGELRLTDDMLQETSGPAHKVGFQSDYPPGKIMPGQMVALSEDGIRAYPRGGQVGERPGGGRRQSDRDRLHRDRRHGERLLDSHRRRDHPQRRRRDVRAAALAPREERPQLPGGTALTQPDQRLPAVAAGGDQWFESPDRDRPRSRRRTLPAAPHRLRRVLLGRRATLS